MGKALKLFLLLFLAWPVSAQIMQSAIVNSAPPPGTFVIAHDSDSNWNTSGTCPLNANTGNTCTWSHTVISGGNNHPFLLVLIGCDSGFNGCTVSSVTFNSVSMTSAGTYTDGTNFRKMFAYYIVGQTGTHNIVVTNTTSVGTASAWFASASSFTGVNQSTPFSVSFQSSGPTTATSINLAVTTVNNNDWIVSSGIGRNTNGGSLTKTQGTLVYANSAPPAIEFGTAYNGPISPAAATNDGWGYSASTELGILNAAIKAG